MTSFASWVLIDMRTMRASGLTKLIPDFRVCSDTRPKKSTTPTWPAGTTVKACDTAKSASATASVPARGAAGECERRATTKAW
jgi:hypothetical protein